MSTNSRGHRELRRLLTMDAETTARLPFLTAGAGNPSTLLCQARSRHSSASCYGAHRGASTSPSSNRGEASTLPTTIIEGVPITGDQQTGPRARMRRTRSASGTVIGQQTSPETGVHCRSTGLFWCGNELQGSSATFSNVPLSSGPCSPTPLPHFTIGEEAVPESPPKTITPVTGGASLNSGSVFFPSESNHIPTLSVTPPPVDKVAPDTTIKSIIMPEITFDEVLTEPSTPEGYSLSQSGSSILDRLTASGINDRGRVALYCATANNSGAGDRVVMGSNHLGSGGPVGSGVGPVGGNGYGFIGGKGMRGSLLTLGQSPAEFKESTFSINYCEPVPEDSDEVCLMYSRHEKIPMKDFAAEIRASVDVENFLSQARLMLDVQSNSLESIIVTMLHHVLDKEEPPAAFHEAKRMIFTHDSAHQLAKTIQSTCRSQSGGFDYDQSWLCILCTAPSVQKRNVAIARLKNPVNLGRTSQEVWFIVLIVTPTREKGTKNALETGRTFSTLFADIDLRMRLLAARTEDDFKKLLWEQMKELAEEQITIEERKASTTSTGFQVEDIISNKKSKEGRRCWFGRGIRADLTRRLPHYLSDYKDGFWGHGTIQKTVATTMFLYFACILPAIALGVLNFNNTKGYIDVKKVIYSQTIGGVFFAMFGGQPMVILLTTAPLAIYTKVVYSICEDWKLDFPAVFACTGLWNSFFLLVYAFTDASKLMRWSTRSTEEIFALFMSIAFTVDAFRDVVNDGCTHGDNSTTSHGARRSGNQSSSSNVIDYVTEGVAATAAMLADDSSPGQQLNQLSGSGAAAGRCLRENSLLFLLLMLGTVWLGLSLYNFTKTPFLNASKRALLADSALPVAVILMSLIGSVLFKDIKLEEFELYDGQMFTPASIGSLSWPAIIGSMGLGFSLSLLFFMDQSISGAMVNSPENRLRKGSAYHWDLMVVAILNAFLSYFGLPMVHGALPHSPLHVRAMADMEERVDQGHVYQKVIRVRETRVTGILCHVMIGLSILCIDKLKLIPRPVLDGLFLYLAITALHNNQLFERIMLLVTEQAAYPPNHYIRTVPQRKIHLFTFIQLLQLAILCAFGFASLPYLKVAFPILLLLLLPTRHKLVPVVVEKRYLQSLDSS